MCYTTAEAVIKLLPAQCMASAAVIDDYIARTKPLINNTCIGDIDCNDAPYEIRLAHEYLAAALYMRDNYAYDKSSSEVASQFERQAQVYLSMVCPGGSRIGKIKGISVKWKPSNQGGCGSC